MQKKVSAAILRPSNQSENMKTLVAIHLLHLAVKAAEHISSVLHSIGHLIS